MSAAAVSIATTQTPTVGGLRRRVAARLGANAQLDARLLVAAALGLDKHRLPLLDETAVETEGESRVWRLVERRLAGEPVSRIVGARAFWSFDLRLNADTLDPRPDTETVVEAAFERLRGVAEPAILDLGTGSGAILIALLTELPRATGIGVDRAAGAVTMARENARRLGLGDRARFAVGDWGESIAGCFDAIVANPPYLCSAEIPSLSPEVRSFDPLLALDGGLDGLMAYRAIVADLPRLLQPSGFAVFEVGLGQADAVAGIAARAGFAGQVQIDLAGRPRALVLTQERETLRIAAGRDQKPLGISERTV